MIDTWIYFVQRVSVWREQDIKILLSQCVGNEQTATKFSFDFIPIIRLGTAWSKHSIIMLELLLIVVQRVVINGTEYHWIVFSQQQLNHCMDSPFLPFDTYADKNHMRKQLIDIRGPVSRCYHEVMPNTLLMRDMFPLFTFITNHQILQVFRQYFIKIVMAKMLFQ